MNTNTRRTAATTAVAMGLSLFSLFGAQPAHAVDKEDAWRIGTYAGAAATAYGIAKEDLGIGLLGAAGTYLAYRQWKNEVEDRHRDERWRRHRRHHNRGHHRRPYRR